MDEAREYGLPSATCFVARRLELVAVAGRLWISLCVLGGADIFRFFFSFLMRPFFAVRAKKPLYHEAVLMRQGRRSETTEVVFCLS